MRNPLRKRLWRELRGDAGKYLVIFLLMTFTIGLISGFLVADGSMITAYNEGFTKYNVEDGNFRLEKQANRAQIKAIEAEGITLYENFYEEVDLTNGSTLRIFQNRTQVNTVCLMQGAMPQAADEIAIDRMYADNNGLTVGDTLSDGSSTWRVTGLVALPDYSCLFQNNDDSMFDAIKFGVAVMSPEGFAQLDQHLLQYSYSWKYDTFPADEAEEKEVSEDLMKVINREAKLEAFVPRYLNQAITFTGEDMGSDRTMMIVLLYIIVAILAFVFAVTINNTIAKEANVIGTLRASGYTRRELLWHYLEPPLLVSLAAALVGNVLGYTVMKDYCAGMYYGSYSLTTYVTIWNSEAFLLTTVVPLALMLVITWAILHRRLKLSPLRFLRRDLSRKKNGRAFPLPVHLPFFTRFRLRVIFQNLSSYAVLFVGILFANMLLMFGLVFPIVLDHYEQLMPDNLIANYQTMLTVPMSAMNEDKRLESMVQMLLFQQDTETTQEGAEKFSVYSLQTHGEKYSDEPVTLYGVEPDSRYISADFSGGKVYISSAYRDKYGYDVGSSITLKEKYEDEYYRFTVAGVYDYMGGLAMFMSRDTLNSAFDLGKDYYGGYFSDEPITDINPKYISGVTDLDALTKISRQLDRSMGDMMLLVDGFSMVMFMVIVYLLSKMIIEKNAQSISMAKVLGYSTGEIARLYILPTSLVTVACILISLPLEGAAMEVMFREVMMDMVSGWIPFYAPPELYGKMAALGIGTYAVVAVLEYRRIRKVPMQEALKCAE